jgi:hypothetical protein
LIEITSCRHGFRGFAGAANRKPVVLPFILPALAWSSSRATLAADADGYLWQAREKGAEVDLESDSGTVLVRPVRQF